jgi:hypothetical protein
MSQTVVQDVTDNVIKAVEEALRKYKDEVLKHVLEDYKTEVEEMINDFIDEIIGELGENVKSFTSELIELYSKEEGVAPDLEKMFKDMLMR